MKNIPSKIFLVVGEESDIEDINDFKSLDPEYVLWSEDRINSNDIEYIREKDNLIPSLETKNKELEGKLKEAIEFNLHQTKLNTETRLENVELQERINNLVNKKL